LNCPECNTIVEKRDLSMEELRCLYIFYCSVCDIDIVVRCHEEKVRQMEPEECPNWKKIQIDEQGEPLVPPTCFTLCGFDGLVNCLRFHPIPEAITFRQREQVR